MSGEPAQAPLRRRAPPEQRRAQILAAALACFSEKGYHAATMDDLVRASGLSKGSLYWHFRSKQDVFLAVFDHFAAEIFAAWDAAATEVEAELELLRRFGEITIEGLGSQGVLLRAWAEFLSHPEARERLARVYRRSRQTLEVTLRRGIAQGEIRALPVEGMAAALTALIEGLLLQAMVDADFEIRAHWPTLWELACRGLAA